MVKHYAIINKKTNLVLLTTSHDENVVNVDYAEFTVVEIPEPQVGRATVSAGQLYYDGNFYVKMNFDVTSTFIARPTFRDRFSLDELTKIDSYMLDTNLSPKQRTIIASFDLATFRSQSPALDLASKAVVDGMDMLVEVGYLTETRKNEILK